MHRVLVTGGAGFIGSHIATALIERGHEVTVLDDLSGGFNDNVPGRASFVQGSVTDVGAIDRLFENSRFDYVYHLAAYAAEGLSHFIKRFNYVNNVIGSVNLINASINTGVKGFVFTSSIAVYGTSQTMPMTEEMVPAPEDPYGIAKYAVERELAATRAMFGLDYIIFRPHNVYGPGQNTGDRYRNVVGIFMNQILHGRPMTIFGDGSQTRAFSYIDDVAPVMAAAIDEPRAWNQVFNVGSDRPWTLNELAGLVAEALDAPLRIDHLPARHEVQHAHASHEKLRRVFGNHDTTDLREGLRAMAAWVRATGVRASSTFEHIEVRKNLPGVWS